MIRQGKKQGWLHLPVDALQPWAAVNEVKFHGVAVGPLHGREDRGSTVIAKQRLQASDSLSPLMTVPRDLILSLESVQQHAKYDRDLRDILECLGDVGRTSRGAILTFLLMQCSSACPIMSEKHGVNSALTEYVKFLPEELLPTFWSESERALLVGTTLSVAIIAKLKALYREFENFRTATSHLDWCRTCWWDEVDGILTFDDWLQVDAMYRSRALEFPGIGDCMAPCIDMANHVGGDATVAIYEVNSDGDAILVLRDGKTVEEGEEVNITYGDSKGACEMVFSYGFIEEDMQSARELFLDLAMLAEDPLGKAKAAVADCPPGFKIYETPNGIEWEGDYIWLVCVNEEDGLDFMLQQTVEGKRELKAFWKDKEIAGLDTFKATISQDPMWDIFSLRAASILQDRIAMQLQVMYGSDDEVQALEHGAGTDIRDRAWQLAMQLRSLESELLEKAYSFFEDQKVELARRESVMNYLSGAAAQTDDEDFS